MTGARNMQIQWRHKDEWKHEGADFSVVVSRHTRGRSEDEVEYCWCIYAYIYPKHRLFERFKPDGSMWEQPSPDVHSYVSFFKVHRKEDGGILSFQLGWDYQHDGDWHFSQMATKRDAGSVFYDAEALIGELSGADE